MDRTRFAYATALVVGAGSAVFFFWWWWARKQKPKPPSKWRKVGELSDIFVFPVKSLGTIRMNSMDCTKLGLRSGWLRDRTLMIIDLDGNFVTARQMPKMVQVIPSISGSILTFNAPGMMSVSIDLAQLRGKSFQTAVWGQAVPACDCGEEPARWLSRFLLQEDTGLRLVYYPVDHPTREIREKNKVFRLESNDTGAYPDATSYNLINEASVTELNSRLEEEVTPLQFRPNFVVKGATPYEEDKWDWVKIGDVIMRNVMPCTRCMFTTINPETGIKHPNTEPLKTLRSYRQFDDLELRSKSSYSPILGIHLALRGSNGTVRLGDPVYVGITDEEMPNLVSPS
ncbi:mitochondrial amidoxime-reducing component 1 [Pseudomyrmex gracilis]|uniref:mitochondrial amidoxime-reducing component 1 n=1 Tax=Pseudomyrmex gracilis TaxID=219809 RepID=UPI000994C3CA|nr:mitochondrial amidoxime-reducing component 1 [Pseudomyrmex gracilis]